MAEIFGGSLEPTMLLFRRNRKVSFAQRGPPLFVVRPESGHGSWGRDQRTHGVSG